MHTAARRHLRLRARAHELLDVDLVRSGLERAVDGEPASASRVGHRAHGPGLHRRRQATLLDVALATVLLQTLFYGAALGAFVWAGAAVAAGHIFHGAIDRVLLSLENLGVWAVVVVVGVLIIVVTIKWWQRRQFILRMRLARVTPREVMSMFESGQGPVIIDARSATARKRDPRRIAKAILIPVDSMSENLAAVGRDREIVVYCT